MSSRSLLHKPPVADLHCDLLCYLSNDPKRTPYDPAVRCSIPQLREGNVKLQVLAIFTETGPKSAKEGAAQFQVFLSLAKRYPNDFRMIKAASHLDEEAVSSKVGILAAIENASSFCAEGDNLDEALRIFTSWMHLGGKFAYISMTWNTENRFGGGAHTKIGLKSDGVRLLNYMSEKGIALDLSHTSDYLAYDLLNYIDKHALSVPVIASHSNLRAVVDVPRNLPDDLAKEILRREGIIGMNFVRYFIGEHSPDSFSKQLEKFVSLGATRQLCFGADFFYGDDVSPAYRKPPEVCFFPSYDHAGAYPKVVVLWRKHGVISEETMQHICYQNLVDFLRKKVLLEK